MKVGVKMSIIKKFGIIVNLSYPKDRYGNVYADFYIEDESGDSTWCKFFDCSDLGFVDGDVIVVEGSYSEREGCEHILIVNSYYALNSPFKQFNDEELIKIELNKRELKELIKQCRDYKPLVEYIISTFYLEFEICAARGSLDSHHDYIGGLVDHISEIVRYGRGLIAGGMDFNLGLFITLAILHDLAKSKCYAGYRTNRYSKIGQIYKHEEIILQELEIAFVNLNITDEYYKNTLRLSLKHHGNNYTCTTKEGQILKDLDKFSAKIDVIDNKLENREAGEVTDYILELNAVVYVTK